MNRRGFLKFLAAVPAAIVAAKIALPGEPNGYQGAGSDVAWLSLNYKVCDRTCPICGGVGGAIVSGVHRQYQVYYPCPSTFGPDLSANATLDVAATKKYYKPLDLNGYTFSVRKFRISKNFLKLT